MHYWIYLSRTAKAMNHDSLNHLIDGCVDYNGENDLTGLLMYKGPLSVDGDAYFMQFLEGPSTRLDQLKQKIAADPRHTDLVTLEKGESEGRTFPNWSMGLRHIDDAEFSEVAGYANLNSDEFWASAQNGKLENLLDLMQFFSNEDV